MDPVEKKRKVGPQVGPSLEVLSRAVPESESNSKSNNNNEEFWKQQRGEQQQQQQHQQVQREEWMTALPEGSRQDALQFFRGGKSSFSAKGAAENTIGSEWSAKPGEEVSKTEQEKAAREEAARERAREEAERVKRKVEEFNRAERPKSLLELHFEQTDESKKKDKKKDKKKEEKSKKKKKKKDKKKKKAVVTPMLGAMEVGTWDRDAHMRTSITTEKKVAALTGSAQLAGRFSTGL